ncbi:MAG TPA: hypothetical protein VN030_10940 [Cellvibrio sp.]|nr:hypothetical protein [Cellvibrio sp.]
MQNYKDYRHKMITATTTKYSLVAGEKNTDSIAVADAPLLQRILALRLAFLKAEELGEDEVAGTDRYWNVFEQELGPLLPSSHTLPADNLLEEELDSCKKHIETLENARYVWLDLQQQSSNWQNSARDYHRQLVSLTSELHNSEEISRILQQYQEIYNDLCTKIAAAAAAPEKTNDIDALFAQLETENSDHLDIDNNPAPDLPLVWMDEEAEQEPATTSPHHPINELAIHDELLDYDMVDGSDILIAGQILEDETSIPAENPLAASLEELQCEDDLPDTLLSTDIDALLAFEPAMHEEETQEQKISDQKTDSPSYDETIELQKIQTAYSDLQKQYSELQEKYLGLKTAE